MGNVYDGRSRTNWPATFLADQGATVRVEMAGLDGLAAVCAPGAGAGLVQSDGLQFSVRLPGTRQAGSRYVAFAKA